MSQNSLKRLFCVALCALLLIGAMPLSLAEAPMEITWLGWNVNGLLPEDQSYAKSLVEEKYNVKIINVPVDTYNSDQMSLMFATGVEFDVNTACDDYVVLADQGLLRPISEELVHEYMPFCWDALEKYAANSWRTMAYADGKMFSVPAIRHSNTHAHVMGVRSDWMANVGVTEVPTTLEGLEELLLKFVNEDPDQNGKNDTYALTKMDYYCDYVFGAYGVTIQGWLCDANGDPIPAVVQPGYKEALKVLQRWYKEKIFDPECIDETRQTCIAKFIAGSIGGYSGNNWAFALGHQNSPVENASRAGIEVKMTLIPPVTGPDGLYGTMAYGDSVNAAGLVFGRNCSDEKMIRIMQIINDELTNTEFYTSLYFGERGIDWEYDEDGYVYSVAEKTNELNQAKGLCRYLFTDFYCDDLVRIRESKERAVVCAATKEWKRVEQHALNSYSTEADLEYEAAVQKISDEFFLKAFTGEIDVDAEWDAYVQRWLRAGGQALIDAKNAAWKAN